MCSGQAWKFGKRRRLTDREIEVADLMARGLSPREIARRLSVQPVTVRKHRQAVVRKTNSSDRYSVVVKLRGAGFGQD